MSLMFADTWEFNQPLDNWNVSNVTNMFFMFSQAFEFNQPLNSWDVSNVTDMSAMFQNVNHFNQPLDNWDVGNVTDMSFMFSQAFDFDQSISNWDVSNVTDMSVMFQSLKRFNYNLDNWDVSKVTNMSGMFSNTKEFNQPLQNWDVSKVTNMRTMFSNARKFNQSLENWDVSKVANMFFMFQGAISFNQSLESWDVGEVENMRLMLDFSGIDIENYDKTLQAWAALPSLQNDVILGAEGLKYCHSAEARQSLIDTYNWTFNGDEQSCFQVSNNQLITNETGATDSFTLTLFATPTSDVVFDIISSDETEASVTQQTITFTPNNWQNPQAVEVVGVDDDIADGDVFYNIEIKVNTNVSDNAYSNMSLQTIFGVNEDDEPANITFDADTQITEDLEITDLIVDDNVNIVVEGGTSLTVEGNVLLGNDSNITVKDGGSILFNDNSVVTQPITFEREASEVGYSILSSPIRDASYASFSGDSTFIWNEPQFRWEARDSGIIPPGSGLAEFLPRAFDLSGIPNIGNQSYGVTAQGNFFTGFNLAGNPYPAAIRLGDFLNENLDVINGTIWIWDATIQNYRPKNVATGDEDFNIASMQGFFLRATQNGDVGFNHNMRVIGNNNNFFRKGHRGELTKLTFIATQGNITDEVLLVFAEGLTDSFDKLYDADKFNSNTLFNISALQEEQELSVLALPLVSESREIPLLVEALFPDEVTVTLSALENVPAEWNVLLKNNTTGEAFPFTSALPVNPESDYSIVITTQAVTSLQEEIVANEESISLWGNAESLTIWFSNQYIKEAKVHIFTVTGQRVFATKAWNAVENQQLKLPHQLPNTQPYIIKIETENGISTKKWMW